jgi:hypothetical protein
MPARRKPVVPKNSPRYKAAVARRKKVADARKLAAEDLKRRKKLAGLTGRKVPGGNM